MNANVNPKTIFTGDNLPIMRGMNSDMIDMIYLDPPFNSNVNYAAPIGSEAAGAEFKDTWTLSDIDIAWLDLIETKHPSLNRVIHAALTNSDKSYLIYMAVRLLEMKRVLKSDGSIYLHCDPTMSHYLKIMMDSIFGKKNFINEIVWKRYGGHKNTARRKFTTEHDSLLFYSAGRRHSFNPVFRPLSESTIKSEYKYIDEDGRRYSIPRGRKYRQGIVKRVYLDEHPGVAIGNLWTEKELTMQGRDDERTGYPTQKPLALLKRIILASSKENDFVLDPFCGCATTMVAADRENRNWIGIDISPRAAELVVDRIKADQGLFEDIINREDIPKRTDLGDIPRYNAPENKKRLYGEQGGDCNGCGEHFHIQHLEIDHIIAVSVGGTDHIDNLQLLCGHCNRIKGDRGQEYLISKLNAD